MRFRKREIIITLILCVTLISTIYLTFMYDYSHIPLGPQAMSLPPSTYHPESASGGAGDITNDRVKDIRQTIVGSIEKGTFEPCVSEIHIIVTSYNGYVYTENLYYTDEAWSGEIITRIPQENATNFVFDVRQLISDNGKVTSITSEITDITSQIGEGEDIPYASIKITLDEVYEKSEPSEIPIISDAIPLLTYIFITIGTGVIIIIPSFFALFALAVLINRGLYPLVVKTFRKSKQNP